MPQITSVSRMKGSAYGAKDFIVGEGREKFQNELTEALAQTLEEKRILIHNALIRHVDVPEQILDPDPAGQPRGGAGPDEPGKQNTAKKLAELNTELSLIEQRREQVAQETEKIKAEIKADEEKQVAEIQAEATKRVAEIAEGDRRRSRRIRCAFCPRPRRTRSGCEEGERAKGLQLKVKAFGDPQAYALWEFASQLEPDRCGSISCTRVTARCGRI